MTGGGCERLFLCLSSSPCLRNRQLLFDLEEAAPRIGLEVRESRRQVVDAEVGASHVGPQLVPAQRRRHRRAWARAGGIGSDRGGAAAVAQIVDENVPGAQPL